MCDQIIVNVMHEDERPVRVPLDATTTAEDVCIYTCKKLKIGTLARHLFALRVPGTSIYYKPSATFPVENGAIITVEFRIRYKVAKLDNLMKLDKIAHNYYFHQVKNDVLQNHVPDIKYDTHRSELIGLGIVDMYRVMIERNVSKDTILSEYKRYMPKEALKRHRFFMKKPINISLSNLQQTPRTASFIRVQYLKQFELIAPNYLNEYYNAELEKDEKKFQVQLRIAPFHPKHPGLSYCRKSAPDEWFAICAIDELGFISIQQHALEICRKMGTPVYLTFENERDVNSFVSLLDGYYRLSCKWTFNICKDVPTPSLKKLHAMKSHGPVGGEFSYAKLEEKRDNQPGSFIIREHESKYNLYYIDVCIKDCAKPKTFKLEKINDQAFILDDDVTVYKSISLMMKAYEDPEGKIYLHECLPPSEYDISPLLLCMNMDDFVKHSLATSDALHDLQFATPVCINWKQLQVYKAQKKEGSRGLTIVYRGMWKLDKHAKTEVAIKTLKQESVDKHLKDFLSVAGQWAFLKFPTIVKFHGLACSNQSFSFVSEYFRMGPLDCYLQQHRNIMRLADLVEAASNLAAALWHLKENDIIHGMIRCRKLMVCVHDDNAFIVKLTDPGVTTPYPESDIHWIPVECYSNFEYARRTPTADVWAFATTVWEIFSLGSAIAIDTEESKKMYRSSKRLPRPTNCLQEVYDLMLKCWNLDPHSREQPQNIARDIKQIYYQVFNSRRNHPYHDISTNSSSQSAPSVASNSTYLSTKTESTLVANSNDLLVDADDIYSMSKLCSTWSDSDMNGVNIDPGNYDECDLDFEHLLSNINYLSPDTSSLDSVLSMQSIFECDDGCTVVLQGKIGDGFYGDVYKGALEFPLHIDREPRRVAVKLLRLSTYVEDFEREIEIMKTLSHPNIVQILGVLLYSEMSLVMEYVQHGSLRSYVSIHKDLETKQLLRYAYEIAQGMDYLAKKNIVHRDLAARNILVEDESHVKISDFGLAHMLGSSDYYVLKSNKQLPLTWYAPESLRDSKFSIRSDVWSYGVTMIELFNYGEEPKTADLVDPNGVGGIQKLLLEAFDKGNRYHCPKSCPSSVYAYIISPCWKANAHERPKFHKIAKDILELINTEF